jgi:Xaa-Pro aminopeptidase
MTKGDDRIKRVTRALQQAGLDALVCTLPANVLLLSGYWPVVGSAVAVATRDGRVAILAPEDERELAGHGWATEVRTYHPGSLACLTRPAEAVRDPLAMLLRDVGVECGRIGYEDGHAYEPASYAAMYLYGTAGAAVLRGAAPDAALTPAQSRSHGSARKCCRRKWGRCAWRVRSHTQPSHRARGGCAPASVSPKWPPRLRDR